MSEKELDEAINIIENEVRVAEVNDRLFELDAFQLGIEALKRIQHLRGYSMTQVDTRLSGETEA